MTYARAALFSLLVASGLGQAQEATAEGQQAPPFTVRLTVKSTTVDPSDGVDFLYELKNVTKGTVACDLPAALNGFHFVFSPVGRGGERTVCPGPFGRPLDQKRPLDAIAPVGGLAAYSMLNFPRDLLPGRSMDRDYPTPPPGQYDLTAVMAFPKSPEGWSGTLVTPPVRVTVVLSKKRRADLAAALPFSPEERLVLEAIEKRLRQALAGIEPPPAIRLEGHLLTAEYRTRTFSVHTVHKTGEIDPVPHGELGPDHKGFLLKAWLERAGVQAAVEGPQDLRMPYWTTHLDTHPLSKATTLRLSLSSGSHADPALLKKLKEAVAAVAR